MNEKLYCSEPIKLADKLARIDREMSKIQFGEFCRAPFKRAVEPAVFLIVLTFDAASAAAGAALVELLGKNHWSTLEWVSGKSKCQPDDGPARPSSWERLARQLGVPKSRLAVGIVAGKGHDIR